MFYFNIYNDSFDYFTSFISPILDIISSFHFGGEILGGAARKKVGGGGGNWPPPPPCKWGVRGALAPNPVELVINQ